MVDKNDDGRKTSCPAFADAMEADPSMLLSMARGFTCVFWGLLIALILFFANAFLDFFGAVRIPAYVVGSMLVVWGLFVLHGVGPVSRAWTRRSRIALILAILQVYFAPFVIWWQAMPYASLLLINCLGLVLAGMLSLFYINLLAAESGRCMNNIGAWTESCLFAAAVFLLMIVPFFVLTGLPVITVFRRQTSLYFELWSMVNKVPVWAHIFILAPCILTLVASWKARERCYREFLAGS